MPELDIEFENFGAPNSELTNCELAVGQFDATKSQLEASNSEVTTVKRRTDDGQTKNRVRSSSSDKQNHSLSTDDGHRTIVKRDDDGNKAISVKSRLQVCLDTLTIRIVLEGPVSNYCHTN